MTQQAVPDRPIRAPRREWVGLPTASLLSLLLHVFLAAGLTKTGLGILSLPTPDAPVETRNIFRPKPARDFPLEVSRSASATAAHERPLDLPIAAGQDRRRGPTGRSRTVSRDRPAEQGDDAAPQAQVPERSRRAADDQPESSPRIDRANATAANRAGDEAVPTLATTAEATVTPQAVVPQPRPPRSPREDRAASVVPRLPREVAVLSKAPSLPVPARRESSSDASDAPIPRATSLSRQASTSADSTAAPVAAAKLPARPQPATLAGSPEPRARPRSTTPARATETAVTRGAGSGATAPAAADLTDTAGASAAPSSTASIVRQRPGESSGSAANPAATGTPLARATVAMGTNAVDGTTVAAIPGDGAAAGGERGQAPAAGISAGAVGAAPRPSAPSFARASGTGGSRSGVSRGGGRAAGAAAGGATDGGAGDEDEGLSIDGMALVDMPLVAAPAGRRSAEPGAAAAPQATALPRATALVLPVETRVREIAMPFRKRLQRDRLPHEADALVARGLEFLKRAQQDDGRWRLGAYPGAEAESAPKLSTDTAATGLAVLCFLGAGHDHFDGPYADTVRRGLEFLLSVQKDDGDLYLPADPLSNSCAWMYSHGIATMALCEAVGMTGDPHVRPAAARACGFISATQHPSRKGWRYTPRSDSDLSVSGWMLIALRSGALAGVPVEEQTFAGIRDLLDAATIPPSAARAPMARFHYNALKPEQRPSAMSVSCMNALGTLMRLHTGWSPRDERILANSRPLAAALPAYGTSGQMSRDCYLWYYASQVLVHTGGESWDTWYAALVDELGRRQEPEGPAAGSWEPLGPIPDRWGRYGGRLYVTTLHLLTLEVPYRHLPTYSFVDEPR